MTQQWQLSGNAESVDWSDLAMAGRTYADNLIGEPSVSKIMHMMADEIERLRAAIRPESYAKNDEKRVNWPTNRDTTQPRNGALSDGPGPDSRVWETPYTPQPHATPPQGSVQGEGSFCVSRNAKEPVAWAVAGDNGDYAVKLCFDKASAQTEADRRGVVGLRPDYVVVPLYRAPTLTDEEREAVEQGQQALLEDAMIAGVFNPDLAEADRKFAATLRKLLERLT